MTTTYCERWDPVAHQPVVPLDDDAARTRFEQGPWFTVVLPGDEGSPVPEVVLELEAGLTTVTVRFFAENGALDNTYVFRSRRERLFLAAATALQYPAGVKGLVACERHDLVWFAEDGTTDHVINERGELAMGTATGRTDATTHWEPLPTFGDWAGLARFDR